MKDRCTIRSQLQVVVVAMVLAFSFSPPSFATPQETVISAIQFGDVARHDRQQAIEDSYAWLQGTTLSHGEIFKNSRFIGFGDDWEKYAPWVGLFMRGAIPVPISVIGGATILYYNPVLDIGLLVQYTGTPDNHAIKDALFVAGELLRGEDVGPALLWTKGWTFVNGMAKAFRESVELSVRGGNTNLIEKYKEVLSGLTQQQTRFVQKRFIMALAATDDKYFECGTYITNFVNNAREYTDRNGVQNYIKTINTVESGTKKPIHLQASAGIRVETGKVGSIRFYTTDIPDIQAVVAVYGSEGTCDISSAAFFDFDKDLRGTWKIEGRATVNSAGGISVSATDIVLDGVTISHGKCPQTLNAFITEQGGTLSCVPSRKVAYQCITPQNVDIAAAILLNGCGQATPDAPEYLREQQKKAQEHKVGIWSK